MKRLQKITVSSLVVLSASCSSSNDDGTAAATTTSATTGTNTVSSEVTSLKDLSLTSVLSISLPNSVKSAGTAAGLHLAEAKSFEACKLRQEMREGLSNIAQASSTLCMIENDPTIEFGKKYNIDFSSLSAPAGGSGTSDIPAGPGGAVPEGELPEGFDPNSIPSGPGLKLANGMPDSMQIWIDNSVAGKLTVYMCQDKVLSQMIDVSAAKKGQAKGTLIMKQDMDLGGFAMKFHRTMSFDSNYTTEGKTQVTLKELIKTTSTQFGSETARRLLSLSLADAGVSKVLSSFSGDMQGNENSFSSVGVFDEDFGSVIAKGSFTATGSEAIEFSNESFFDGKSFVVDPEAHPTAFGASGKVKVAQADLPGYLSATFTPDDFPAGAWDCSGTTDIDFSAGAGSSDTSAMTACMASWDELSDEDCFSGSFSEGEEVTIDPATLETADEVEFEFDVETETEATVAG